MKFKLWTARICLYPLPKNCLKKYEEYEEFLAIIKVLFLTCLLSNLWISAVAESGSKSLNLLDFTQNSISGRVVNAQGLPVVDATITVIGTTNSTLTDGKGDFTLTAVPSSAKLRVTHLSYMAKDVSLDGNRPLNIILSDQTESLDEVVVTSFGIQRDRKTLGYAVAAVKSDELAKAPTTNVTSALAGRLAGVQVSGSGGGFSGPNITIRGFSTFTGSNQPLYVVDGIPIDNSGGDNTVNTGVINSSRVSDINPQDIESINVLKGAAATVLYGSRAASGVILITTKKAKKGSRNQISFGTNTAIGMVSKMPSFQNEYAQGSNGIYNNSVTGSWGPKIAGQEVVNWFGEKEPLQAFPDNIRDILQNSVNSVNDVSFMGSNEKYDYRVSYGYTLETGLVPTNELKRNNISANFSSQLFEKLKMGTSFSYVNNISDRTQGGNQGANPLWRGIFTPRSYDLTNKPFADAEGNQLWFASEDHPYWSIENIKYHNEVNRFFGNLNFQYAILPWLSADLKIGTDLFQMQVKGFDNKGIRSNGNTSSAGAGGLMDRSTITKNVNSYFTLTANRELSEKWNLLATVGQELISNNRNVLEATGLGIVLPDFDNQSNFLTYNTIGTITKDRSIGVFGDLVLDYKNFLSINVKARNDFSSTLAKGNRSIFYPAAAVSLVLTDAFPSMKSSTISMAKLRANVGEVGKGTEPYTTNTYYARSSASDGFISTLVSFPFQGLAGYTLNNRSGNVDLRPEFTREYELGMEWSFFNGRIGFEGSVYKRDTRNLIFAVPAPASSGFTTVITNAGRLSSKGLEMLLNLVPVKNDNLQWQSSFNFTTFKSTVEELAPGVSNISIGGFTSPNVRLVAGEEYGQLWSNAYLRNEQGQMIINSNGLPKPTSVVQKVGNPNPKFTIGWSNNFAYKDFSLSFLLDFKYKGDIMSRTIGDLRIQGVAKETADFDRIDATGNVTKPYLFEGVYEDGTANSTYVSAQQYYSLQGKYVAWEGYVLDATFVKLREANISYRLPDRLLKRQNLIKGVNVAIYGRNLFTYAPNFPHLDPEQNLLGISNARGLEFGFQPTSMTIGGTVRFSL